MLRQPGRYNVFLLPSGRKFAEKIGLFGSLEKLPKDDWALYATVEHRLRALSEQYPYDWRQRIQFSEQFGFRYGFRVGTDEMISPCREMIRDVLSKYSPKFNDLTFLHRGDCRKRGKVGKMYVLVDTEIPQEFDGVVYDYSGDVRGIESLVRTTLGSKLTCYDFIKPGNGCKYPNLKALLDEHGYQAPWLVNIQAGWLDTYKVTRPLRTGMLSDWFSKDAINYAVVGWCGFPKFEGDPGAFSGTLVQLPRALLTEDEFRLQREIQGALKRRNQMRPAFIFVSFRLDVSEFGEWAIHDLSNKRIYGVIIPWAVVRVGKWAGEDFAKDVLSKAVSTMDRPSKLAITIVSGIHWNVDVVCVTPCVDVVDNTNPRILKEILTDPVRIAILGRKGSGKSRLSRKLSDRGYNVMDSDTYGKILFMCENDYSDEHVDGVVRRFLRMTLDERKAVSSFFEVSMCQLIKEVSSRGLTGYGVINDLYYSRYDRELFLAYDQVYDQVLRQLTPEVVRDKFFSILWEGSGFDDCGEVGHTDRRSLIFSHTLVELFQIMNATICEIVPTHSSRVAIQIRHQGETPDVELYLHDYYEYKNGNGCAKVGLGWLTYLLDLESSQMT
uniref:VP8 n=1 Tax=Tarumizu tick virus TaxID=2014339 RepID=A0A292G479_9REOV|nr:VP8 [Tarumizu tick virus]